jgi:hypothetical protein
MRHFAYWCFLRLIAIGGGILGWKLAGWVGLLAGLVLGCIGAILFWGVMTYYSIRRRHLRRLREISKISSDRLRQVALDPTSVDGVFAQSELARRGIDVRPSLESLCNLLTSDDSNSRGLAMSLLMAFYPNAWFKIPEKDASNLDSPEKWRSRISAFKEGSRDL